MNGVLIIDKPQGFTSHDVVHRVRRILGEKSVGHLGTLDPAATGVLPLVTGSLTRLAQFYLHSEKSYEGVIRFGFATDTYDGDGEPVGPPSDVTLSLDDIRSRAGGFVGKIQQLPPPFSAKKIDGTRAYKLARQKQPVALELVTVEVKEFEIASLQDACASFRARVSSGTYMRSIAHDLGQQSGCGAHLASLRRTAVAEFGIADAHTLEDLEVAVRKGSAEALFVHPRRLMPQFPSVVATEEIAGMILHGRSVNLPEMSRAPLVKVFYGQNDLIAVATRVAGTLFHARIVLMDASRREVALRGR